MVVLKSKVIDEITDGAVGCNSLTYNKTKLLIETGIASGNKSFEDYAEVINHEKAIDIILYFIDCKVELTERMIFDFNKFFLRNTKYENQSGQYNKIPVSISTNSQIANLLYLIGKNIQDLLG